MGNVGVGEKVARGRTLYSIFFVIEKHISLNV